MSTFSCITVNNLEEISLIAGSKYTINFYVYSTAGSASALAGTTCTCKIYAYGYPETTLLTLTGVKSGTVTNLFTSTLTPAQTTGSAGKYIYQPIIVDVDGSVYKDGQGIMTILP